MPVTLQTPYVGHKCVWFIKQSHQVVSSISMNLISNPYLNRMQENLFCYKTQHVVWSFTFCFGQIIQNSHRDFGVFAPCFSYFQNDTYLVTLSI